MSQKFLELSKKLCSYNRKHFDAYAKISVLTGPKIVPFQWRMLSPTVAASTYWVLDCKKYELDLAQKENLKDWKTEYSIKQRSLNMADTKHIILN